LPVSVRIWFTSLLITARHFQQRGRHVADRVDLLCLTSLLSTLYADASRQERRGGERKKEREERRREKRGKGEGEEEKKEEERLK